VDAEVAELVLADRLLEAARLSSARGDAIGASQLFERACDWRSAASEALRGGDAPRALDMALRAGDAELGLDATAAIAHDEATAGRVAAHLVARGRPDWAARVLEAIDRDLDAARAWERAGEMTRAASLYERAREPAQAARVLEAAVRRDPADVPAALALGALLARFGKDEASLRVLQPILRAASPGSLERRDALERMLGPLRRLGFGAAAEDAARELALPPSSEVTGGSPWLHGRYDVVRLVGSSVSARLVEAFDRARAERVALKVYATGDRGSAAQAAFARIARELRALRALEGAPIVPVRDVVLADSTVVFGWMEGGSLDERLGAGPLEPSRAVEIASAVLTALGEAHRIGVLHRAVKPTNVLFDAAGAAHLADFGAAHAADASATVTAGDFGALAFQSPEQREGRPVSARSDLFAVGVLLAEMLGGRRHTQGGEGRATPIASPGHGLDPRLDARHERVLASLLARAPEERPADAFQARDQLRALPWPGSAGPARGHRDERGATAGRGEGRLEKRGDRLVDAWTGRPVECVALSASVVARARIFAASGHDAWQTVLRMDREAGTLWLAGCAPLARALRPSEAARVAEARRALLAAGTDPATLDPPALGIDGSGEIVVRF
jgi:serine/threonine-protein kinase